MIRRETTKTQFPVTLDILDEIDTQLDKEDKGQFLDLISRIRHLGMKLILIGQNPKVGRVGLQWADMEQMTCFYQMSSALDAIKNNPALDFKSDILTKQYHEISEFFQAKNEWLDNVQKHYFGLCVIPGKAPQWYELPVADTIDIDCDPILLAETFEVPNSFEKLVEGKISDKSSGNFAKTNKNSDLFGKAETLAEKEMAAIVGKNLVSGVDGKTGKTDKASLPTCKKHPGAELRMGKDSRPYCPGCKKRLSKSELQEDTKT